MAKKEEGVKWNKVYIATMTKENFIKVHKDLEHLKGIDLNKVYEDAKK